MWWFARSRRLKAVDFHRAQWCPVPAIAACQPDARGITCSREVASCIGECRAEGPGVGCRIISVHLIRRIRRSPAAAHDPHLAIKSQRPCLTRRPWYAGNRADGVCYGVINEGIGRIDDEATLNIGATAGVD